MSVWIKIYLDTYVNNSCQTAVQLHVFGVKKIVKDLVFMFVMETKQEFFYLPHPCIRRIGGGNFFICVTPSS